MNINAINSMTRPLTMPQTKMKSSTAVQSDIKPQYNMTSLDAMSMLGRSMVNQPQKHFSVSFNGWSPEAQNKDDIEKMVKIIKNPDVKKIAISGHTSPDGDSFGTTFAMANLINQATGKKVDVFVFGNNFPSHYDYLNTNPNINVIVHKPGKPEQADEAAKKYGKYDLAIACDCSETKLMAADYRKGVMNKATYSFKIDHHPYKEEYNEKWGKVLNNKYASTINLIDSTLPAAAEIAMQFVEPLGLKPEELRKEAKDAMFTGILTDTGCLKYAQSALTFEDVALLMKAGVNNREVNLNALGNTPKIVLEAEKTALDKIQYSQNGKVAYFVEDDEIKAIKKACKEAGYAQEGKDAVRDVCGRLPELQGVEVGLKAADFGGKAAISIRSRSFDVSAIAQQYGGGGHKNAAAFSIPKNGRTLEKTVEDFVKQLSKQLENAEKTESTEK